MEEIAQQEHQENIEEQEDQQDDYEYEAEQRKRLGLDYPSPRESESLYNLFHKVLRLPNSSKVGNLDPKTELGFVNLSVRDCQNIALLARELGHPKFAEFFEQKAEITLSTSASKKGWFTELFVSQKKFSDRISNMEVTQQTQQPKRRSKWKFGPSGGT